MPTLWQTVNESLGGLCIQKADQANLVVGNASPLIFNKKTKSGQKHRWQLGLSRWQKNSKGFKQVGIKLVAGEIKAVHLSNQDGELVLLARKEQKNGFLLTKSDALTKGGVYFCERTARCAPVFFVLPRFRPPVLDACGCAAVLE